MENKPMPIRRYDYTSRIIQAHEAGRKDWLEVIMKSIMYDLRFHAQEYSDFCFLAIQLKMAQALLFDVILTKEAVIIDIDDDMYERYQFIINIINKHAMTPEQQAALLNALLKGANIEQNNIILGQGATVTNHYHGTQEPAKTQEPSFTVIQAEESEASQEVSDDQRMKFALKEVQREKNFRRYDWTWVREVMADELNMPFGKTPSFIRFIAEHGVTVLPKAQAINDHMGVTKKGNDGYVFSDTKDTGETIRRNNIMRRFLSAYRKLS